MPEYRTAFPTGTPVPSETDARWTPEQLALFCRDRAAMQRLVTHIVQLGSQHSQATPDRAPVPERTVNGD